MGGGVRVSGFGMKDLKYRVECEGPGSRVGNLGSVKSRISVGGKGTAEPACSGFRI